MIGLASPNSVCLGVMLTAWCVSCSFKQLPTTSKDMHKNAVRVAESWSFLGAPALSVFNKCAKKSPNTQSSKNESLLDTDPASEATDNKSDEAYLSVRKVHPCLIE